MSAGWKRVSRHMKCPICSKTDWCGVSDDGTAVICMREPSQKATANGGWLHRIGDSPPPMKRAALPREPEPPARDWIEYHERTTRLVRKLPFLAQRLGVNVEALHAMNVGFIEDIEAWTFPMRDGFGCQVGEHLRFVNGEKRSIKGSKLGLFMSVCAARHGPPAGADKPVLVCEGASDTAYLIGLGHVAIGRPSNISDPQAVRVFLERTGPPIMHDVYIVADRDDGEAAARNTARGVSKLVGALRMTQAVRRLYVIRPPANKDVRSWRPSVSRLLGVMRSANPLK